MRHPLPPPALKRSYELPDDLRPRAREVPMEPPDDWGPTLAPTTPYPWVEVLSVVIGVELLYSLSWVVYFLIKMG